MADNWSDKDDDRYELHWFGWYKNGRRAWFITRWTEKDDDTFYPDDQPVPTQWQVMCNG